MPGLAQYKYYQHKLLHHNHFLPFLPLLLFTMTEFLLLTTMNHNIQYWMNTYLDMVGFKWAICLPSPGIVILNVCFLFSHDIRQWLLCWMTSHMS